MPERRFAAEYAEPVEVAERIRERGAELTAAERRIAEVVLEAPQSIGFGTVADLVPLDANNRVLVSQGLRRIRAGRCVLLYSPFLMPAARIANEALGVPAIASSLRRPRESSRVRRANSSL